ncbi:MAG: hypothetical protein Q9190_000869 [Brigantiaea leucoxantha]
MHFSVVFVVTLLPVIALSQFTDNYPTPTLTGLNSAQVSALDSYTSSVAKDTDALSPVITALATMTATPTGTLDGSAASKGLQAAVTGGKAADLKFPKDYPAPVTSYINSIYQGEASVLSKYASSTGNFAPAVTGRKFAAAGAAVMGAVGAALL